MRMIHFYFILSAIYSVRVRQFDQPDERVDELEMGVDRQHEMLCDVNDALPVEQEDALRC